MLFWMNNRFFKYNLGFRCISGNNDQEEKLMLVSLMWAQISSFYKKKGKEMNQEIYFKIMIFVFQIIIAILSLLL